MIDKADPEPSAHKPRDTRPIEHRCPKCGGAIPHDPALMDRVSLCPGCGVKFILWTGAEIEDMKIGSLRRHLIQRIRAILESFGETMTGEAKGDLLWLHDHVTQTPRGASGQFLWSRFYDDMTPEVRDALILAVNELTDNVFGAVRYWHITNGLEHVMRMLHENKMHEAGVFTPGWLAAHVEHYGD